MLLFAHVGITLGAALVFKQIGLSFRKPLSLKEGSAPVDPPSDPLGVQFGRGLFDLRCWIIGSMLPDLIDKPIGHFFFNFYFNGNGRIFAHTLLFFILIMAAGSLVYLKKRNAWLMAIGLGDFCHLILDSSWLNTLTLFWPVLGLKFPFGVPDGWIAGMLDELVNTPAVFIPEILGFIIVVWFASIVLFRKKTLVFLKSGQY